MLPSITAADVVSAQDPRWFRIGPRAAGIACALAQRVYDLAYRKVAIVHTQDRLSVAFAQALGSTLATYSLAEQAHVELYPLQDSTLGQDLIAGIDTFKPDAIVLASSTQLGPAIAQNLLAGARLDATDWFLSPPLLNETFITDMPEDVMNGALGIGPSVASENDAKALAARMLEESGTQPFEESFFYYDAMALLMLATESAFQELGTVPDRESIRTHMSRVSRPPGLKIAWDELPLGLETLRLGEAVDYAGITGNLSISADGTVDHDSMRYRQQRITAGKVVPETFQVCVPVQDDK